MGQGLRINYNDGSPIMEITAGLRAPAFCNNFGNAWDVNTYQIGNYIPGSQVIVLPKDCLFQMYRGTSLIPTVGLFDSFSVSGSTITMNTWWSDNWGRARTFPSSVWQIAGISSGNAGLKIQNSSDFTVLPVNGSLGYCCWSGTVTTSGGQWSTPQIAGLDRNQYIVFAKWDAPGITVEFDGLNVYCSVDQNGTNQAANVTMRVAIFAPNIYPNKTTGLSFVNAAGQCTFSTERKPFVYENVTFQPSFNFQDIGNRMVMLGRYGFTMTRSGGWENLKWSGLMMQGTSVKCSKGRLQSQWTDKYTLSLNRLTSIPIPCIQNMY